MKDYEKKVEECLERLREVNRKAQKFTIPKKNLMELKLIEMDDLLMARSGYRDCPFNVELTELWWIY